MKTDEVSYHLLLNKCCGRQVKRSEKILIQANSPEDAQRRLGKQIPEARFNYAKEVES